MPLVKIAQELRINLNGYDRDAVVLEPGEHVVPERAAEWLRRHPEFGEVIDAEAARPTSTVAQPQPAGQPLPEPSNTEAPADDESAEDGVDVLDGKVAEVVERIAALDDAERLATLQALEEQAAKPRKGILDAIVARLAELDAEGEE